MIENVKVLTRKAVGDQEMAAIRCYVRSSTGGRVMPSFADMERALADLTDEARLVLASSDVILLGLVNTWVDEYILMNARFASKPIGPDQTMKVFGGQRGERIIELEDA